MGGRLVFGHGRSIQEGSKSMRARLFYPIPFRLTRPQRDGEVEMRLYNLGGYGVLELPPIPFFPPSAWEPRATKIDGLDAIDADMLLIDFFKEGFVVDEAAPTDPPEELINTVVNNHVRRMRYVSRNHRMQLSLSQYQTCIILYSNDDGSALKEFGGRRPFRVISTGRYHKSVCSADVMKGVLALHPEFVPPVWDEIRLDAQAAMPHIGSAIALAAVALERFIKEIIDKLGNANVKPPEIWTLYANNRDTDKRPSVEDMYDTLLQLLTGHSLRDEPELWDAFMDIKEARNKFVHEGVPRVRRNRPQPVVLTEEMTYLLLDKVDKIIARIREWIPAEMRWPIFDINHHVEVEVPVPNAMPPELLNLPAVQFGSAPPPISLEAPPVGGAS
jgi:hypothetical protein